jgi:hypothetical protein
MTKVSAPKIEELGLQSENFSNKAVDKSRKTTVIKSWTEEEEMTLAELLKTYKWSEWEAIAAHMKNRTGNSVESKIRYSLNNSNTTKEKAKKELGDIAKMVRRSATC